MCSSFKLYFISVVFLVWFPFTVFSQRWQSLQNGLDNAVACMYGDSSNLYIGGWFRLADDSIISPAIVRWDGTEFHALGCGFDWNCSSPIIPTFYPGPVLCITSYNGEIVTGGLFDKADNKPIKGLAKWNGIEWDSIRSNVDGVSCLFVHNSELFAGGSFDSGTVHLTKWDGSVWTNLPEIPGFINAGTHDMAFYNNELYVGGMWTSGPIIEDIFKWDGTGWEVVGIGIHTPMGGVYCLEVYQNELYAAGEFTIAEGNAGNYIMKWDGISWQDVGGGVMGLFGGNGTIEDLHVFNNELYAVGVFSYAGGVPANFLAKWDGSNWCSLGSTFDNRLYSCTSFQNMLYVGGGFWTIDGDSIAAIAKWTGGNYVDSCGSIAVVAEQSHPNQGIIIHPNPLLTLTTITLSNPLQDGSLFLYDLLGHELTCQMKLHGREIYISREGLQRGVTFFRIFDKDVEVGRGKFLVL